MSTFSVGEKKTCSFVDVGNEGELVNVNLKQLDTARWRNLGLSNVDGTVVKKMMSFARRILPHEFRLRRI